MDIKNSDMVGGMLVVGDNAELAEQMAFLQNSIGGVQGPFDSFLAAARNSSHVVGGLMPAAASRSLR